ncbi:MAG: hypothetical protein AB1324_02880 [Candidatus Micrarchaeota archaeon]
MKIVKIFSLIAGLLVLSGVVSAGCALDAYNKACASCQFDSNGKIDKDCQQGYQSSGTACVSTSYPIMAGKYAAGECPQVDACAEELRSCTAQYSSGNDKADCQEGSVSVCYSAADACVRSAARACGEIETQCPGSAAGFALLFAGIAFVKLRG